MASYCEGDVHNYNYSMDNIYTHVIFYTLIFIAIGG